MSASSPISAARCAARLSTVAPSLSRSPRVSTAEACPGTALLTAMPLGFAGAIAAGVQVAPAEHRDSALTQLEAIAADYGAGKLYAACNSEKGAGGSLAATKTVATR